MRSAGSAIPRVWTVLWKFNCLLYFRTLCIDFVSSCTVSSSEIFGGEIGATMKGTGLPSTQNGWSLPRGIRTTPSYHVSPPCVLSRLHCNPSPAVIRASSVGIMPFIARRMLHVCCSNGAGHRRPAPVKPRNCHHSDETHATAGPPIRPSRCGDECASRSQGASPAMTNIAALPCRRWAETSRRSRTSARSSAGPASRLPIVAGLIRVGLIFVRLVVISVVPFTSIQYAHEV